MGKYDQVDKAYNFLVKKEINGESFTLDELANFTGWKRSTCKTYPSKRWNQYVDNDGELFTSIGIKSLKKEDFRKVHSQKLQQIDKSELGILLSKAREFALLATSIYNNPYTAFRTYGFIVNIVIAWTALFHAIFEKKGIEYFHKGKDGHIEAIDGEQKAFELSTCCKTYWKDANTPEKANLDFLIGLRNRIEHRSLPALDMLVAGECQATLSNFESLLVEEFGNQYALQTNLAIALQLTRISQQAQSDTLKQLQTENYKIIREYMETYKNDLEDEIRESQKYRISVFLIPKLGNHAKSADLCVEFINTNAATPEELENYEKVVAFIKGVEIPYKLRPGQVVKKLEDSHGFNMSEHTKAWKLYKARPKDNDKTFKGEYAGWVHGFEGYLYTEKWVKFLIEKLSSAD
jgi:Protein of unknown function (DUF3644)